MNALSERAQVGIRKAVNSKIRDLDWQTRRYVSELQLSGLQKDTTDRDDMSIQKFEDILRVSLLFM